MRSKWKCSILLLHLVVLVVDYVCHVCVYLAGYLAEGQVTLVLEQLQLDFLQLP